MSLNLTRRAALTGALATAASSWAGTAQATAEGYVVPEEHMPRIVTIRTDFLPGDIHVDPWRYYLYLVLEKGLALRYVIGVARASLYEAGTFTIARKAKWPSWRPTDAMIEREPETYGKYADGMPGGRDNPLGARALYLYEGERDTYLRIHGTPQPWTVGTSRSNGCVRLVNAHIADLYERVPLGSTAILHG